MNSKYRIGIALLLASLGTVCSAQKVARVSLVLPVVVGGTGTTGTVEISAKAPVAGIAVNLTSGSPSVTVPPCVTVPSGQTSITFPITSIPVAVTSVVNLKASVGTSSESANIKVTAPEVSEFTFIPTTVQGGSGSTASVKIGSPAPIGGIKVHLTSTTPLWGGPEFVTIPAGATANSFTFTTSAVGVKMDATVSAIIAGAKIPAILTLTPPILTTFVLSSTGVMAGSNAVGTLKLNGVAPKEGVRIALTSDSGIAKIPESVTIPAGQTTAIFDVLTKPTAEKVAVRILARAPASSIELAIAVNPPAIDTLTLSQTNVPAGSSAVATLTLNVPAPNGGYIVALSSNQSLIKLPASVVVPAGKNSITFTLSISATASFETATITATTPGGVAKNVTLSISPSGSTKHGTGSAG